MSFYRYALVTPEIDYIRSLTPLNDRIKEVSHYSYRYYTSQNESANEYCKVISLGHEIAWAGKSLPPKIINRYVIRYVVKGAVLFCGQIIRQGYFFFSTPSDEYEIEILSDKTEMYYIGAAGNGAEAIMKKAGFFSIPKISPCPFIDSIPNMFYGPLFEAHSNVDVDFYLLSFFFSILALHKPYISNQAIASSDLGYTHYNQAIQYIHEYYLQGISAKDVADFLHLSPSYLRTIFAKYCKYSLREYLIRKRIDHAAFLITRTDCNIKEAAHSIGYEDYALFSRIFKKYMGMSPQSYRDACGGNTSEN